MNDKTICGTCRYGHYDKMQGYVCVNGDSEWCIQCALDWLRQPAEEDAK